MNYQKLMYDFFSYRQKKKCDILLITRMTEGVIHFTKIFQDSTYVINFAFVVVY